MGEIIADVHQEGSEIYYAIDKYSGDRFGDGSIFVIDLDNDDNPPASCEIPYPDGVDPKVLEWRLNNGRLVVIFSDNVKVTITAAGNLTVQNQLGEIMLMHGFNNPHNSFYC